MMDSGRCLIGLVTLMAFFPATSQEYDGVCACTPGSYKFTFNFTSACIGNQSTGGINASYCSLEGFGNNNVTDFMPVSRSMSSGLNVFAQTVKAQVLFRLPGAR